MQNKKTLTLTQDKAVTTITLNRPEKCNAVNELLIAELTETANTLATCSKTRVVVLKAAGKHFCAGADLNWMRKMADFTFEENKKDAELLMQMLLALANLPKPTIAMVQGNVFGGGLGLMACCDFVICESTSQFCFSEAKLGLTPSTISPFVRRVIGYTNTLRYFLSAERFDAHKAKAMNLVYDAVPANQLAERVESLTKLLLQNGALAMKEIKRLAHAQEPITPSLCEAVAASLATARATEEAKEGIKAFFEKRKPQWSSIE